jgi:hypothetical protein
MGNVKFNLGPAGWGGVEKGLSSFFNIGSRRGWLVNATLRPLYPWDREPIPILPEAVWVPVSL